MHTPSTVRIHITGGSGSGVTTLGRALSATLAIPHHDTDDYYWKPTEIPYTEKREVKDRLELMERMFLPSPGWVLSGSLDSWSETLLSYFDLVIYLDTPKETRLSRLREREVKQWGEAALKPGGERHDASEKFLQWASGYEEGNLSGRSLMRHEAWLKTLPCPVLRLQGTMTVKDLLEKVLLYLGR